MRKVCVVIGSRANYSSIKSVMSAVKEHSSLELQVIATASAVVDRYGAVVDLIKSDGFKVDRYINTLVEGESLVTMAKSTGLGIIELASTFENMKPDIVVTVGDRFETMATALSAAYLNIPLAHSMGGEVSGNIDESIRHAVTKFANIHFVASSDAYQRVIQLGEVPESVFNTGCPRMDLVAEYLLSDSPLEDVVFKSGVGMPFSLDDDFIIISQHPVTSEYGSGENQILETLNAVNRLDTNAIVLWPNADAGSDGVSRGIRKFREKTSDHNFYYIKNLPIESYVRLMKKTICLVGNSSSGIREGAFIGTPVVNVGSRQTGRERSANVLDSGYEETAIYNAVSAQIRLGQKYKPDSIYGDGHAGKKIAEILSNFVFNIQKRITF